MKTLRENDSGYRIEPVGAGLGDWVIMRIEGDADQVYCNPTKTLYSKIMYKYEQFNEMKTFPYFRDYN